MADEPAPSTDAVTAAFNALSADERQRLKRFAYYRMMGVTGLVHHAGGDDLLQEAITRTLEGKRLWNPKNTFFQHLVGCMSSIANELAKEGGRFTELLDRHPSTEEDIHTRLEAKARRLQIRAHMKRLRSRLQGDTLALEVLETLLDEKLPREVLLALKMQPDVYAAARKRIDRAARRLFGPAEDNAR